MHEVPLQHHWLSLAVSHHLGSARSCVIINTQACRSWSVKAFTEGMQEFLEGKDTHRPRALR